MGYEHEPSIYPDRRSTRPHATSGRLYEERLKNNLEKTHLNDFCVIEPESGDYYLGTDLSDAMTQHGAAHPDRLYHIMRVGHRAAFHIGGAG